MSLAETAFEASEPSRRARLTPDDLDTLSRARRMRTRALIEDEYRFKPVMPIEDRVPDPTPLRPMPYVRIEFPRS